MAISIAQPLNEVSSIQKQKEDLKAIEEKRSREKAEQAKAEEKSRTESQNKKAAMTEDTKGNKFDRNA